ncbi:tRNA (adenosine(37)-N6)-threonylcarbamoyltransferase complex dimerization subunit type 1 TsaB [Dyadobacter endophyticus]|uniref:tRNA (Adenosine(37)-N6)-threonylcarbamoyltransferase complex dimerization subunit type 1 TsaB n=1 Tax=Dyadobacter endophyticus TaxID=1749036 RepID=A0ABQ1Z9R4_9BACT|nr:tRNA (adenosine(37)-N6)-threonylcarbamoyltransferase complex dimerization subunit type 1 TsaB [Dyadobacter endophyticus]GGH54910.1 tRNA (adenosine(37)-N6)-threonylcarbamoyltransferase complex dimerization subunit type 1 TsaB [Dyadobacter endophyticus]
MLLLSIDTSIRGCSVAVHNETGLLAAYDLFTDKSSSAMLTTLMRDSVAHAGFKLADVDAIVVAKGPGSYTGLRVGVSTAKGLCYALDKPLIAINTLQAMALQLAPFFPEHLLCPMIDARRMEVYAAVLDDNNAFVQETQAVIMNENSFEDLLADRQVVFFGDGAAKCKPILEKHSNAIFPAIDIKPSARTIGQLGTIAFQNAQFQDVASFEPYYLKDFMSPAPRKASTLVQ